ncbi:MAG: hypothetical protein PHU14_09275 [Methylovulum sp.]|nr:hypothetical protein [Methylovulum sp.]
MKPDKTIELGCGYKAVAKELKVRDCAALVEMAEGDFAGLDDLIFVNTDKLVAHLGGNLAVTAADGTAADMADLCGSDWDAIASAFVEANTSFLSRRRAKKALDEKRQKAESPATNDLVPGPSTVPVAS